MRTPLEMHFPHQSPRKIGINPKAQMQPQLKERRIQDRQRRCHHKKPSQRLSNPGKVMVKERVRKERSPKGHLRRAKLSPLPKLRPRRNPKVSRPCHVYSIQRVHVTVEQNVLLHMGVHQQPRRRQSRPKLHQQRRQPLPLFWPAVQARLPGLPFRMHQS